MQLLRQAEVRLAKCLRANAARESEKKLFFVNFPGKNRFILYYVEGWLFRTLIALPAYKA